MTCSVIGCALPVTVQRWQLCNRHWLRLRRHGSPTGGGTDRGAPQRALRQVIETDTDDCVTWPLGRSASGYGKVQWNGRQRYVHQLLCELTHGPMPEPGMVAAHGCGRGEDGCVNPRHVRWATRGEDAQDRVRHGTTRRGERQHAARLTEADVHAIRHALASGETQKSIAERHGVDPSTISYVHTGRRWGWLQSA